MKFFLIFSWILLLQLINGRNALEEEYDDEYELNEQGSIKKEDQFQHGDETMETTTSPESTVVTSTETSPSSTAETTTTTVTTTDVTTTAVTTTTTGTITTSITETTPIVTTTETITTTDETSTESTTQDAESSTTTTLPTTTYKRSGLKSSVKAGLISFFSMAAFFFSLGIASHIYRRRNPRSPFYKNFDNLSLRLSNMGSRTTSEAPVEEFQMENQRPSSSVTNLEDMLKAGQEKTTKSSTSAVQDSQM